MRFDEELHERLGDLADSTGPWDDPLPAVLERAAAERRTTPIGRRRWNEAHRVRRMLGVAATVAVVAGGGAGLWQLVSSSGSTSGPSTSEARIGGRSTSAGALAAPGQGRVPSCDSVPVSSGTAAGRATVSVRLLRSATGAVTGVRPQLHVPAGGPAITATGSARVVVLAGSRVVASRVAPPAASSAAPRTAPLPTSTCSGRRLPAGRYTVIVAVGYRSAVGAAAGVIVSTPVPITVR